MNAPPRPNAFQAGVLASLPTQAMVAPFGALSGVVAAAAEFDAAAAAALSVLVFAGAAQIIVIELFSSGAPILIIVATGLAINLRFLMYGAALAPWFRGAGPSALVAVSYLNTDNSFAVALERFRRETAWTPGDRVAFFLGSGVLTWAVWQAGTVAGFLLGTATPAALGLDFLTPIAFIAITLPLLSDRPAWAAALAASVAAVALSGLPLNLHIIAAGVIGVGAGLAAEALGERAA